MNLSPPQDGSEFELFPELHQTSSGNCVDKDMSEVDNVCRLAAVKSGHDISTLVQMNQQEERSLLTYLSGGGDQSECTSLIKKLDGLPNGSKIIVVADNTRHTSDTRASSSSPPPPDYFCNKICMSKTAIAARENRQKKKKHMEGLQSEVSVLSAENYALKTKIDVKDKKITKLSDEVTYLKSVIANESAISSLLRNIHTVSGLKFASEFVSDKQIDDEAVEVATTVDAPRKRGRVSTREEPTSKLLRKAGEQKKFGSYQSSRRNARTSSNTNSAGVCLHVKNNQVSLELCESCSTRTKGLFPPNVAQPTQK